MTGLPLDGLVGTNPLAVLAALGALDVAARVAHDRNVRLSWTNDELSPRAVLTGPADMDELVSWVDDDRQRWRESPVLAGTAGISLTDIKPDVGQLHRWAGEIAGRGLADRAAADLFCALLAEGAVAGNGDAKPTHLHFTAGRQQFLTMVRELADKVDAAAVRQALTGPWTRSSTLPSLSWDSRGERIYALRGPNPSNDKRTGEPGADWLAFLGLTFFPVAAHDRILQTTGCWGTWKEGSFVWPLWEVPISARVVRSLLADPGLRDQSEESRRARGIFRVLEAPIQRSDQGGYGNFRPAQPATPLQRRPRG